jgi:hypothetical protein
MTHTTYTIEQKVWSVIWYGQSGSHKQVQIEYHKKFGKNAKAPDSHTIHDWWQKVLETGSVVRRPRTKTPWRKTVMAADHIRQILEADPHMSLSELAKREDTPSLPTIRKLLKVCVYCESGLIIFYSFR